MAVTWTSEITITNAAEKRVSVTVTRTDDAPDALFPIWSRRIDGIIKADLQATKAELVDRATTRFLAAEAEAQAKADLTAGWETALSKALNDWEGARDA